MATDKPNGNGTRFLTTWVPVIGAGVVAFGTMIAWFSSIGAMQQDIASLKLQNQQQARTLARMEGEISAVQVFQATQKAADCQLFARVETQFGTVETAMNLIRVNDQRSIGRLEQKILGTSSDIFYSISIPHDITPC